MAMPKTDSQEPENSDPEKLFKEVFDKIPKVVGQVCAKSHHPLYQTEIDDYAQRIGALLCDK
jgi:hypothetical protein